MTFSDHCLVTLGIGKPGQGRSKFVWGLWKLNRKLLEDDYFNDRVVGFIGDVDNTEVPLFERWEMFKENVKMSAIERSSEIAFKAGSEEKMLRENLKRLCLLECDYPGGGAKDISAIKTQLNAINDDGYSGAVFRARAEKFLMGEQPTKRALASEKKYAASKEINYIQNGPILTSDNHIITNTFAQHYKKLFSDLSTQSHPDIRDF